MKAPKRTKADEEKRAKARREGVERSLRFQQATQGRGKPMTFGTGKSPSEKRNEGKAKGR